MGRAAAMLALWSGPGFGGAAHAGDLAVAVAANFTAPAKALAAAFTAETGDSVDLSFGSTGQLYAQIGQGAPFEIFLAADTARPQRTVADGLGVAGSVFTYAVGQLVLWSADPGLVDAQGAVLKTGGFSHIAVANPETAPYGAAAMELMDALGVLEELRSKIVMGTNVNQTLQFVATGNAELGLVARSQISADAGGSTWVPPRDLYAPIYQGAVLLKTGEDNLVAKAFLAYLKSPQALEIIEGFGYGLPD